MNVDRLRVGAGLRCLLGELRLTTAPRSIPDRCDDLQSVPYEQLLLLPQTQDVGESQFAPTQFWPEVPQFDFPPEPLQPQ
jgi:hypothetical protein